MTEMTDGVQGEIEQGEPLQAQAEAGGEDLQVWVSPKLEDVSEQVMAQPYIRFT